MSATNDQISTAPVGEFCRLSGIGRSRVYELIADGSIESFTLGKRRLIVVDSYRKLIERQRTAGQTLPRPGTKAA
jgi:excisionase family DNA binding protein